MSEVIAAGQFTKPSGYLVAGVGLLKSTFLPMLPKSLSVVGDAAKSKMEAITKAGGFVAHNTTDIPIILKEKIKD
jgi:succinyl-CoA synthetase alpha subunit